MKKILFLVASTLVLFACKNEASNKGVMDVITITDNGISYADTIIESPYGKVIPTGGDTNLTGTHPDTAPGLELMPFTTATDKNGRTIYYGCEIRKNANNSLFSMIYDIMPSSRFPIRIIILNAVGPANGIGIYKSTTSYSQNTTDTTTNKLSVASTGSSFKENFKGGQEYKVDSVTVNVTKATGPIIEGSYKMWLTNAVGSKTVVGTIIYRATIN